jgi:hypothetical protein
MTIDNVPQAKWLATAPPDDMMIARFTKLGQFIIDNEDYGSFGVHLYFDTATDLIYQYLDVEYEPRWSVTDPNRKGIFA